MVGTRGVQAPFVAPTRLKAFLGLSGANGNRGLAPPAPTKGLKQDGAFPTSPAWILSPSQPGPAIPSGTGSPTALIHPAWPKITSLISLFKQLHTSRQTEQGESGGEINTCKVRLPWQAGPAEQRGPRRHPPSLVLAGRVSTGLQRHSHRRPSSRLHTEVIHGESNLAALEENARGSQWDAAALASTRCTAQPLVMQVLAVLLC